MSGAGSSARRVLLVEDDPEDIRIVEDLLRTGDGKFVIARRARCLAEAERELAHGDVDVALLDLSLPDGGGLEALARLQSHSPEIPIVALGGQQDEELAAQTVQKGAQDYLEKDRLEHRLLVRSMRYAIERMTSKLALAHERTLLRELLAKMPDRIYFKDRQSRFTLVNDAMAKLFGLERPEDAIGKTDFDFFLPEHARPAFEDEQRIIQTGKALVGRIEKETLPDGRIDWVSTTKLPLRDARGDIVGTFGMSRVITRLKRMEEALNAERLLLRNVIDNLLDPIYLKGRDGRYKLDNRAHAEFLGFKDDSQIVGKTVYEFFSDDIARKFDEDDQKVMDSGKPLLNEEEEITDTAGNRRWHLTTKVPLRDPEGNVTGLVCIGRDITEQKEAKAKLVEANANLLAALTDLKKAHAELRSVQLQLIEAEKLKSIGRLAAGVAHEVKNPLAIITMGIDYLAGQEFDDENVPAILHDLADAVKRADAVIKGLLDFSAPQQLDVQVRDLNAIIERSLILVRGEMDHSLHRVETDLDPDLEPVPVDRGKMGQVFVNLFTNSLHAMEKGGTLRVRTFSKQLTGVGSNVGDIRSEFFRVGDRVVVVEIEDDGHGVPENSLSKLFDPFYTTKPTGQGTGLGLSVTKSIIDLHRGTISIANRPEGGARVTIMLKCDGFRKQDTPTQKHGT